LAQALCGRHQRRWQRRRQHTPGPACQAPPAAAARAQQQQQQQQQQCRPDAAARLRTLLQTQVSLALLSPSTSRASRSLHTSTITTSGRTSLMISRIWSHDACG
jgi:hypothetical protein